MLKHSLQLRKTRILPAILAALAVGASWASVEGQDARAIGWADKAELSYLMTGGNAVTSTLGISNILIRTWANDQIKFQVSAVRAHATTSTRRAVGTADRFSIAEEKSKQLVAENYFADLQYDRKISDRWSAAIGLGWDRNRFSGVESRFVAAAGAQTVWIAAAKTKFKTDYHVTWTARKYISAEQSTFLGFRGTWDFEQKLTETTTLSSQLLVDESLKDLADWRGDMVNALGVAMSKNLALKVSLRLLYANKPAQEKIPLDSAEGISTGLTVLHGLKKLDSIVTTSLVVNF